MAIQWADFPSGSHGLYGPGGSSTAPMLNGIYAEVAEASPSSITLSDDPDPNIGSDGTVLKVNPVNAFTTATTIRKVLTTAEATALFSCRLWLVSLPTDNSSSPKISFRDSSNATLFCFRITTTGAIAVYSGSDLTSGTKLGETAGPVITANAWTHIAFKGTADTVNGSIDIEVEGTNVLSLTVQDTGAGPIAQIAHGAHEQIGFSGPVAYWKDTVYSDTTGDIANDFLGSVSVFDLELDGDVTLGGWTTSSGATGYDLINEAPPIDTDYIQAGVPVVNPAQFSFADLPVEVSSVKAVIPISRMKKSDGGDCKVQMSMISDSSTGSGSDRNITTAFTYWWDCIHTDPATSAAWLPAAVNAADFQLDRTL